MWDTDALGFEVVAAPSPAASTAAAAAPSERGAAPPRPKRRASGALGGGGTRLCSGARPPPPHSRLSLDGASAGGGGSEQANAARADAPADSEEVGAVPDGEPAALRYECACGSSFSRTMLQYHQSTETHRSWLGAAHRHVAATLEANAAADSGGGGVKSAEDDGEDLETPKASVGSGGTIPQPLRDNLLSVLAGLAGAAK